MPKAWTLPELKALRTQLMVLGINRSAEVREKVSLTISQAQVDKCQ